MGASRSTHPGRTVEPRGKIHRLSIGGCIHGTRQPKWLDVNRFSLLRDHARQSLQALRGGGGTQVVCLFVPSLSQHNVGRYPR